MTQNRIKSFQDLLRYASVHSDHPNEGEDEGLTVDHTDTQTDNGTPPTDSKSSSQNTVADNQTSTAPGPPGLQEEAAAPGGDDELKAMREETEPLEKQLPRIWNKFRHMPTMTVSTTHRRFIFVWHFFMIIGSFGLVALGVMIKDYSDSILLILVRHKPVILYYKHFFRISESPKIELFYGALVHEYGLALIVLGALFLIVTVLYISFLGHRFPFTWPMLVVITLLGLIIQLSNILVRLSPMAQISTNQKRYLKETLKNYRVYSPDAFSVTYDYISLWGQCCGITSKYDFQNDPLTLEEDLKGKLVENNLQVPPTCCHENIFRNGTAKVIHCAKTMEDTNEIGCYEFFFVTLKKSRAGYVLVLMIMLCDLVIHIYIYSDMVQTLEVESEIDILDELENERRLIWLQTRNKIVQKWQDEPAGVGTMEIVPATDHPSQGPEPTAQEIIARMF